MTSPALDVKDFRKNFPEFSDEEEYKDDSINVQYKRASFQLDTESYLMTDEVAKYAMQLMLAHMLIIQDKATKGNQAKTLTSGSEGGVSASFVAPIQSDEFHGFLSTTLYGAQLSPLLKNSSSEAFFCGSVSNDLAGLNG